MSRTQLRKEAHITSNALAKMGKDEFVRVDTLAKICTVLGCKVDDIMEIIPDSEIAN